MASLSLLAPLVLAQGFGLDLTADGPELRPSIAVLGIVAEPSSDLAPRMADALVRFAKAGPFARVLSPEQVEAVLEDGAADARACREPACLTVLCHQLQVDRLVVGDLGPDTLDLLTFDWGSGQLERLSFSARQLQGPNLDRRAAPLVQPLLQRAATLLGQLEVTVEQEAEEIRWGDRLLGAGASVRAVVPAGTHPLRISAPGFHDHEELVEVEATVEAKVEVTLQRKVVQLAAGPRDPTLQEELDGRRPRVASTGGKPVLSRPGLYVAIAGAAALGVGVGFGQGARRVQQRAVDADGDGALDVTRAQVQGARRSAAAANVLGGLGIAGMAAGGAWLFFDGGGVSVQGSF